MEKTRFAVLGCGVIAPTHIWAIDGNEKAELTALCDLRRDKMEKLAEDRDLLFFDDWKEMLASPEIDAVAICLPHYLHGPALIDCLEAGKHVICEKPMGVNLEQLSSMKEAARAGFKKGLITGGIFQHRFSPLVQAVAGLLEKEELGVIEEVSLRFLCTRNEEYYGSDAWRGKWDTEGGGLIINQAIHTMDLLIQLMGMPDRIEGKLFREKLPMIEVEDRAEAVFFYEKGRTDRISLSLQNDLVTSWQPEIRIKGSKHELTLIGSEEFTCTDPALTVKLSASLEVEEEKAPGKECYGSLHSRNYADFLTALEGKTSPLVSLDSLADSTEAVLAVYQSHFSGSPVSLPLSGWTKPETLPYKGEKA